MKQPVKELLTAIELDPKDADLYSLHWPRFINAGRTIPEAIEASEHRHHECSERNHGPYKDLAKVYEGAKNERRSYKLL